MPGVSRVTCPKCGLNPKSGKLTCCTRGGAWFEKCGDDGDPNLDHTWTEGIDSCIGKLRDAHAKECMPIAAGMCMSLSVFCLLVTTHV